MRCIDCKLCTRIEKPVYYKIPNGVKCGIQLYFRCEPHHAEIENPFIVREANNWCGLFIYNEDSRKEKTEE